MVNYINGTTVTEDTIDGDIAFVGQVGKLVLKNLVNINLAGFSMQGYLVSGEWVPIPQTNISRSRLYYSLTALGDITFNGLTLGYINGANTTIRPAEDPYLGFLATINLQYS